MKKQNFSKVIYQKFHSQRAARQFGSPAMLTSPFHFISSWVKAIIGADLAFWKTPQLLLSSMWLHVPVTHMPHSDWYAGVRKPEAYRRLQQWVWVSRGTGYTFHSAGLGWDPRVCIAPEPGGCGPMVHTVDADVLDNLWSERWQRKLRAKGKNLLFSFSS